MTHIMRYSGCPPGRVLFSFMTQATLYQSSIFLGPFVTNVPRVTYISPRGSCSVLTSIAYNRT